MTTGLVLSGGGARGAYEVGLVAGIVDVLGLRAHDRAPFQLFAGTSVGAINAAYLAAHTDRGDMHVDGLIEQWKSLSLERHVRLDPLRLSGLRDWRLVARLWGEDGDLGRSFLDPTALHELVEQGVPWRRLHDNVRSGRTQGLLVTALHISTGRTHMFAELAPERTFRPSPDPRRQAVAEPITADHVLASAALPMIFPARRVGSSYFCDGGLRFNTPLSPAIRAGADRLVVIPLLRGMQTPTPTTGEELYPSPFFLLGKLLAALLLDPIDYDLKVLARTNDLMETLERTLTVAELERLHHVLRRERGATYRRIDVLSFRPSTDIGTMAGEFLHEPDRTPGGFVIERIIRHAAMMQKTYEADFVSFLLFDEGFAERLIALGRADAHARADDIARFFAT